MGHDYLVKTVKLFFFVCNLCRHRFYCLLRVRQFFFVSGLQIGLGVDVSLAYRPSHAPEPPEIRLKTDYQPSHHRRANLDVLFVFCLLDVFLPQAAPLDIKSVWAKTFREPIDRRLPGAMERLALVLKDGDCHD